MTVLRVVFAVCLLAVVAGFPCQSPAQTPEQIRVAFRNIRDDDIPWNASTASAWILDHRNQLTRELLDELYRTDRQGRDVIINALISTRSFHPDERFCRMLITRLNEEDTYLSCRALGLTTHWNGFRFCAAHYDDFKDLLFANAQTTDDMWCLWGTVSLWQKRGELADRLRESSPHFWDAVARSLRDDDIGDNAGQAVMVYLIIGKASLPHLEPLTRSNEAQTRDYATATIDAMNGSKRAYGYLESQVRFENLFDGAPEAPAWASEELDKWDPHSRVRQRYSR